MDTFVIAAWLQVCRIQKALRCLFCFGIGLGIPVGVAHVLRCARCAQCCRAPGTLLLMTVAWQLLLAFLATLGDVNDGWYAQPPPFAISVPVLLFVGIRLVTPCCAWMVPRTIVTMNHIATMAQVWIVDRVEIAAPLTLSRAGFVFWHVATNPVLVDTKV